MNFLLWIIFKRTLKSWYVTRWLLAVDENLFRVRCRRRLEVLRVVSEIEKLWGLGFSNMPKIPNSAAVTSALLEFWPFFDFLG